MAIKELEKFDFDEEQEQIDFISLKKSTPVTLIAEDDCISRRAVLEQTYEWSKDEFLRVAKPFDYLRKRINSLSPAIPQPKTGHWLVNKWGNISCSECGCTALYDKVYPGKSMFGKAIRVKTTFCPTCGAKMQEVEKNEDKMKE